MPDPRKGVGKEKVACDIVQDLWRNVLTLPQDQAGNDSSDYGAGESVKKRFRSFPVEKERAGKITVFSAFALRNPHARYSPAAR
jgi:hypothetical protein